MPDLLIPDVDEKTLSQLRIRADAHGRKPQAEARAILEEAVQPAHADVWARVQEIHSKLATSSRQFSDSAEMLRDDRDR